MDSGLQSKNQTYKPDRTVKYCQQHHTHIISKWLPPEIQAMNNKALAIQMKRIRREEAILKKHGYKPQAYEGSKIVLAGEADEILNNTK